MNIALPLSNPILAVVLRTVLGAYVVYMARRFYADPMGYFRKSARQMVDVPWLAPMVRGMACFCLWGGCFIVATAFAVQVFGLHGDVPALTMVAVAALAAWLLLPKGVRTDRDDRSQV
jgi:hypothetical protein